MLTKGKQKRMINALKKSIKHWNVRTEDGETHEELECPACKLGFEGDACVGFCPIALMTGREDCDGTPFYAWNINSKDDKKSSKKYARRQVKFLQKVLKWVESWKL